MTVGTIDHLNMLFNMDELHDIISPNHAIKTLQGDVLEPVPKYSECLINCGPNLSHMIHHNMWSNTCDMCHTNLIT